MTARNILRRLAGRFVIVKAVAAEKQVPAARTIRRDGEHAAPRAPFKMRHRGLHQRPAGAGGFHVASSSLLSRQEVSSFPSVPHDGADGGELDWHRLAPPHSIRRQTIRTRMTGALA